MTVWYLGMACLALPMTGNACMRGLGESRTPAAIMIVAGGLNVVLGPLFIFGVGSVPAMGIRGAAIASVLARATTMLVGLSVLAFRERVIELSLPRPGRLLEYLVRFLQIALVGLAGEGAFKVASSAVTAAGKPAPAMAMMVTRLLVLVLPLAWIGRHLGGPVGMFAGMGQG